MKMEKEDIFKVISAITTIFVFKAYKIIKKPSERDQVVLYLKDKIKETTGSPGVYR